MKLKHILFAFLVIFAIGFTSCEKEPDPQLLSEFVIGTWQSQELVLGDSPFGTFTAVIKETHRYTLTFTLSDNSQSISCPETDYAIDDVNSLIIITEPDFDPNDGETPTGTQTFAVTWVEGQNTMLWTPDNGGGNDAPTLQWTRGD